MEVPSEESLVSVIVVKSLHGPSNCGHWCYVISDQERRKVLQPTLLNAGHSVRKSEA